MLAIGEAAFIKLPCLVISTPTNVTLETTSPMGAQLTDVVAATNHCGEPVMVQQVPPSGVWLPLGTHPVNYQVFAGANYSVGQVLVTVADTTPPDIAGVTDRTVEATSPEGAVVMDYGLIVTDNADPAPLIDQAVMIRRSVKLDNDWDIGLSRPSRGAVEPVRLDP